MFTYKHWFLFLLSIILYSCTGSNDKAVIQTPKPTSIKVRSVAVPIQEEAGIKYKIYPFKKAKFTFSIFNSGMKTGTMTILIDDYGNLESKRSEKTNMDGSIVTIWSIKKGNDIFGVDINRREIIKAKLPGRKSATLKMDELERIHGSREAAESYLKEQGIQLLPDEEIKGYLCQVYQRENNGITLKKWVHKGVELQMAVSRTGSKEQITRKLLSVDFDPELKPDAFKLPIDYSLITAVSE